MNSETAKLGDGRWSTDAYANGEVVCDCLEVKSDIEKAAGTTFTVFIPVSFRLQVEKGKNYLVKVAVEETSVCVHAMLFQDLGEKLTVTGVQYPKTMVDHLVPFLNTSNHTQQ